MPNLINNLGGTLGFGENALPRSDDGFLVLDLRTIFGASALKFFGTTYNYLSININGNVTLSNSATQGLTTYTPFGLADGGHAIIAPFFADVDTRQNSSDTIDGGTGTSRGSDQVHYDIVATGNGKLTITWDDVGYYSGNTPRVNAFQLEIVGQGSGNFDIVFRYEAINWTTGDASGGIGGLGGTPARAGYSTGDGARFFEVTNSGVQDAMLALESTVGNTGVAGFYQFAVRNAAAFAAPLGASGGDDLAAGTAGDDHLATFGGNDFLMGHGGADTLEGGSGDDYYAIDALDTILEGGDGGTDTVIAEMSYTLGDNLENLRLAGTAALNATGNSADNLLAGNGGNNVLNGLRGFDTVSCGLARGGVTLDLSLSTAQALPGLGSDTLVSIEGAIGSMFDDVLRGTAGANALSGGSGDDALAGREGRDTLVGGGGADTLLGGAGADRFRFETVADSTVGAGGRDTVRDFTAGEDRIDLRGIDAATSTRANEAFTFIGTAAFRGDCTGQLRFAWDSVGAVGYLYGSTDADANAEFAIRLTGVSTISAADLVL